MSIIVMVMVGSILEGLNEIIIETVRKIKLAIETSRFKKNLRSKRIGYRADYKTRMKYKIESMINEIVTPN